MSIDFSTSRLSVNLKTYMNECIPKERRHELTNDDSSEINWDLEDIEILRKICEENMWLRKFLDVRNESEKLQLVLLEEFWVHKHQTEPIKNIILESSIGNYQEFLLELEAEKVISDYTYEEMMRLKETNGNEEMVKELSKVLYTRRFDWLGKMIFILQNYNRQQLETFFGESAAWKQSPLSIEMALTIANQFIERQIKIKFHDESNEDNDDSTSYVFIREANQPSVLSDSDTATSGTRMLDSDMSDDEVMEDYEFMVNKPKPIELYQFQEELCKDAINGRNTIICSPTGSGKTIMAANIINKHLDANPESGRVAFIVNRVTLAFQQSIVFKQYCGKDDRSVICLCSLTRNTESVATCLSNNHILVCTGGTLCNGLFNETDNPIKSLSEFSLIIFDECHHVLKDDQYTKILQKYFSDKQKYPDLKLPQIIGLTASPRCNKQNTSEGIKNSLYELVASLDCLNINIVKEHVQELQKIISIPTEDTIVIEPRSGDDFEKILLSLMSSAEDFANKVFKLEGINIPWSAAILCDKQNGKYNKYLRFLRRNVDRVREEWNKQMNCIIEFLKVGIEAFMYNQIVGAEFALKMMKDKWLDQWINFDFDLNKMLMGKFEAINSDSLIKEQKPNPALQRIVALIKQIESVNPDYRVIIFVKRVQVAFDLAHWLSEQSKINSTGLVSPKNLQKYGLSKEHIETAMKQFKMGTYRVLVATTILEEGYDVPNCNLVISYGHVSNETALIQRKGRARHKDSKYCLVLIAMHSWMEKLEIKNKSRWLMMKNLIENFHDDDPSEAMIEIDRIQKKKCLNPVNRNRKVMIDLKTSEWKLKHSCDYDLTSLSDLRLVQSHVVVTNPKIFELIEFTDITKKDVSRRGECKLGGKGNCKFCRQCVGRLFYIWDCPFFYIYPTTVIMKQINGSTVDIRLKKSWHEIIHLVPELKHRSNDWNRYEELQKNYPLRIIS